MNREDLYDALVGLCQQVGITTEATYESLRRPGWEIDRGLNIESLASLERKVDQGKADYMLVSARGALGNLAADTEA